MLGIVLGFHSLNARDNTLFHWLYSDAAKGDPQVFRDLLQEEARHVRVLLSSRNIDYEQLKSALIPTANGRQIAFLYDWWNDPSWNYAVEFAKRYLPHLRPELRTSVFQGDTHPLYEAMPIQRFREASRNPGTRR
jgi:hypothetical protein